MNFSFEDLYLSFVKEFEHLKSLILEKNQILNLTRIVGDEDFKYKNIEDSIKPLFLSKYFNLDFFCENRRVLDLGTGGGFPLLPLVVLFSCGKKLDKWSESKHMSCLPHFTGLDSVQKKVRAVSDVVKSLGAQNVELIADRAESLARNPVYRQSFDCVVSRAVAQMPVLLEYSVPFVRVGGMVCMYKSFEIQDELLSSQNAMKLLGVRLVEKMEYSLSYDFGRRTFLVFEKVCGTPDKFPRNVGVAKKTPIV